MKSKEELSQREHAEVHARKVRGETNREIGLALGISSSTVSKWLRVPLATGPVQVPIDEQILHLRARVQVQDKEISNLRTEIGEQKEIKHALVQAVRAIEPFKRVPYKAPSKSGSPVTAVLNVSDWQIGEIINAAETEGFGRFDWETAQRRMFFIVDKFIAWVNAMRSAYRIDECRIFRLGDLVSGNIHKELEITNEFPAPVATAKAGFLLAEVASRISAHFSTVVLEGVDADNHGRLNPKPQAKQKAHNNWCYLAAVIAEEALKKHGNVDFRWTEGMKYVADVNGQRFLLQHGDTIKSSFGIPYYGMERDRAREATRRMNTDKTFGYIVCGHWHVRALIASNIYVNGCLTGTTEFDHGCGRHAPPTQLAFLVHPKHGVFNEIGLSVN